MKCSRSILSVLLLAGACNIYCLEIRERLEALHEPDQSNRQKLNDLEFGSPEWKELWKKQTAIDEENMKVLESILLEHGWPKKTKVGFKAAKTAFLILQHARPEYQKKYIGLLRDAVAEGEAEPGMLALLEDRILMHDGKPQIYGSQLVSDENGTLKLWPIGNEKEVDQRRAEVGLEPLADYLARFGLDYEKEAKKPVHPTSADAPH